MQFTQGFPNSVKGWGRIGNFAGFFFFLSSSGNLRRGNFDHPNLFQS